VTPLTQLSAFLIIATFALVAGCAGTPESAGTQDPEASSSTDTGPECPAFKTLVVEEDRYYCVDDDLLEDDLYEDRDW